MADVEISLATVDSGASTGIDATSSSLGRIEAQGRRVQGSLQGATTATARFGNSHRQLAQSINRSHAVLGAFGRAAGSATGSVGQLTQGMVQLGFVATSLGKLTKVNVAILALTAAVQAGAWAWDKWRGSKEKALQGLDKINEARDAVRSANAEFAKLEVESVAGARRPGVDTEVARLEAAHTAGMIRSDEYFARREQLLREEHALSDALTEASARVAEAKVAELDARLDRIKTEIQAATDSAKINALQAEGLQTLAQRNLAAGQARGIRQPGFAQSQSEFDQAMIALRGQQRDRSFGGGIQQWSQGLASFNEQGQLAAKTMDATLRPAIDGVSSSIMGVITGTATWGQTMMQVGLQIIQSLINIGIQMMVNAVLSRTIQTTQQTQAAASGASIAASYAPAAVTSGAATMGIGTAIGVAVAIAAVIAGIAMLMGAFAEGGLVPGAPSNKDNRIAKVATGEFIIPARVVSALGPEHFEAYRQGKIPGLSGNMRPRVNYGTSFATGGLVGESAIGRSAMRENRTQVAVGFINTRQQMRDFTAKDGYKILADQSNKRGNRVIY